MSFFAVAGAAGHPGQHGPGTGHLPPTIGGDLQFVKKIKMHDVEPGVISDVSALGNYAYLGRYQTATCGGPEGHTTDGGVYVIDIHNPSQPREIGFIEAHQDTLVAEGVQALHIDTPKFNGDVLVINHESCGKNSKAGTSLWNITDPTKPTKLSEHFGDFTRGATDQGNRPHDANQTHSAFAWDAGNKAYMVSVDDEEANDVDIFDITNPKHPALVAEYDLTDETMQASPPSLNEIFLHDMVVKKIGNAWIMLLSYWDGGYAQLDVTEPANATFIGDTDYAATDPQRDEHGDPGIFPEGNGHQAEFAADNEVFVATDEDFAPFGLRNDTFTHNGTAYAGKEGAFTKPIYNLPGHILTGRVVWTGGFGCTPASIPPRPAGSEKMIALIQRGVCFFEEKADSALARGYDAFIVANDAARGDALLTMAGIDDNPPDIPGFFVGFTTGEAMKTAPVGQPGGTVVAEGVFNGWGYVHLFNRTTFEDLDTYAIEESQDPAFGRGFGALSVHEVATDPQDPNHAYLSYYAGGLRSIDFSANEIVETGRFIDVGGNDFWGVDVLLHPTAGKLILASDRDYGLYIFRRT